MPDVEQFSPAAGGDQGISGDRFGSRASGRPPCCRLGCHLPSGKLARTFSHGLSRSQLRAQEM